MELKINQKLDEWQHTVKQSDLVTWSKILNDPNPIHLDKNKVIELGFGHDCINQGPANIAYVINCISKNFKDYELLSINNKLKGNVFSGDEIKVNGIIIDIKKNKNDIYVSLELNLKSQAKDDLMFSKAEIKLKTEAKISNNL